MMPKYLLFAAFLCPLLSQNSTAQDKTIPVEVVVDKLSHKNVRGFLEKNTESVFKFYADALAPENCITSKCLVLKSSDKEKSVNTADDISLSSQKTLKTFKINPSGGLFSIKMESFKNDKGDPCEFDKGDNYHSVVSLDLKLTEHNPGVFSAPLAIIAKDDKFAAAIRFRYGIPAPTDIVATGIEKVNDPQKTINLQSKLDLANKTNLGYVWEYKTDDDPNWKELGKTNTESLAFTASKDVFKKQLKTTETIHLRIKAVSPEMAGSYSATTDIVFTPAAPSFDKNEITTVPSCPNSPSGSFTIKTISGTADNYAYYILKSKSIEAAEYPDVIEQGRKTLSGTLAANKPLSIQKLDEGDYTLVLYNANMQVGKMFSTHSFSIKKYATLSIKSESAIEATCGNIPDGQILLEMEGGNPGKLITTITPNIGKVKQFNRNIVFSELLPGTYTVFVKDECSQTIATKEIEILKKAVQIKGKVEIEIEPLNNFPNGTVKVSLEGGSGQFKYILTKGNTAKPEKTTTTQSWLIDNISAGSYKLKIIDMSFPLCPGWDTSFTVKGRTLVADTTGQQAEKKDTIALPKDSTKTQFAHIFHQIKTIAPGFHIEEYTNTFYLKPMPSFSTILPVLKTTNGQSKNNTANPIECICRLAGFSANLPKSGFIILLT